MLKDPASIALAAFFSFLGVLISIYQILCHLRNYTEPLFQRYIIRIIFMVPVYAIGSFCSLQWRHGAIYFDTLRDCYEAWIIYNFSALLLAYVGGPGAVVVMAEGKIVHPSWSHMTCCLPAMPVDGFFLRRCKQGTVQFVLLKPVMAALTLIMYAAGAYTDGDMSPSNGYFYISILYNVCYTLALYGLILFWIGASELLQPFNPLLKFVLVKTVVFLTFWQGIGISCINSMGRISDPEDGKALQNFMICTEMAIAGIALLYAFPHKEYQMGGSTTSFRLEAFTHAISIRDVVADAIHVFAPSYSDYVLYSDGGPADNVKRKKFRGQTGTGGDHPKARKPMTNVDARSPDLDGRRSKMPNGGEKVLAANRNQAILLDSDSDGIDTEDEGSVVVCSGSDADGSNSPQMTSDDEGGMQAPSAAGGRSERTTGTVPSARATPRPSGDADSEAAAAAPAAAPAKEKLHRGSSSRKPLRRVNEGHDANDGQEQPSRQLSRHERRASRGLLIKASYPAGLEARLPAAAGAGGGSGGAGCMSPVWRYRGTILSDSDGSDTEEQQQQQQQQQHPVAVPSVAAGRGHTNMPTPSPAEAATSSAAGADKSPAASVGGPAASPMFLAAPFTRTKAAAVRKAVAGAAQAAGRAMAAQAGGAPQQTGAAAAPEHLGLAPPTLSNPIVLPSPKPAFLASTGHAGLRSPAAMAPAAAGPGLPAARGAFAGQPDEAAQLLTARAAGAAAAWEPQFPGASQQEAHSKQWAEGGWSDVAL